MNLLSGFWVTTYTLAGLTIVIVILVSIFEYCSKNHLKEVYKWVLITILIIVAGLDFLLFNKEFPILSFILILFQVIGIPIIAWNRPEHDFSNMDKK